MGFSSGGLPSMMEMMSSLASCNTEELHGELGSRNVTERDDAQRVSRERE
jgi:hypothetical protein